MDDQRIAALTASIEQWKQEIRVLESQRIQIESDLVIARSQYRMYQSTLDSLMRGKK